VTAKLKRRDLPAGTEEIFDSEGKSREKARGY
jgi:hypothetical protein